MEKLEVTTEVIDNTEGWTFYEAVQDDVEPAPGQHPIEVLKPVAWFRSKEKLDAWMRKAKAQGAIQEGLPEALT